MLVVIIMIKTVGINSNRNQNVASYDNDQNNMGNTNYNRKKQC